MQTVPLTPLLLAPLGQWRTELLVRLLGFSFVLELTRLIPLALREGTIHFLSGADLTLYPWSILTGCLLLFTGARLLPLLLALLTHLALILQLELRVEKFPYDEVALAVLFLLGCVMLALADLGRRSDDVGFDRSRFDATLCRLGQIILPICMAFVALHKVNADFLGESSCFYQIQNGVANQWRLVPVLHGLASPLLVTLSDGLAALLLVLFPRLGFVFMFLLLPQWGISGPTGTTLRVMFLAVAFLDHRDLEVFRGSGSLTLRRKIVLAILVGSAAAASGYLIPSNIPTLINYAAYLSLVVFFVALGVVLCVNQWRSGESLFQPLWHNREDSLLGCKAGLVVASLVSLLLLNEMSPYLGIKVTFSHKMYTSLRVDFDRWNSLVFPRALQIFDHVNHQLVSVESFVVHSQPRQLVQGEIGVRRAGRLEKAIRGQGQFDWLSVSYSFNGRTHEFEGTREDPKFEKFMRALGRLPRTSRVELSEALGRMTSDHPVFQNNFLTALELRGKLSRIGPEVDGFDLVLRQGDEVRSFPNAASNPELDAFLSERIPTFGKVRLNTVGGAPQACIH